MIRSESARYANPLTFLPGNIPVSEHVNRLLAARSPFVACYADLNHFKPFNDQIGIGALRQPAHVPAGEHSSQRTRESALGRTQPVRRLLRRLESLQALQ